MLLDATQRFFASKDKRGVLSTLVLGNKPPPRSNPSAPNGAYPLYLLTRPVRSSARLGNTSTRPGSQQTSKDADTRGDARLLRHALSTPGGCAHQVDGSPGCARLTDGLFRVCASSRRPLPGALGTLGMCAGHIDRVTAWKPGSYMQAFGIAYGRP